MIYLYYTGIVFLSIRIVIALVNILSSRSLKKMVPEDGPLVSLLIPARNEAERIEPLLESIATQNYKNYEVIVYDDDSRDNTIQVVEKYRDKFPQLKILKGGKLPPRWVGKNHACHILGEHANGAYLLFLDADVTLEKSGIQRSIRRMKHSNLALLSVFPVQMMKKPEEWITVPLMDHILLSLLPLPLVKNTTLSSLAAANGQFMFFKAENYHENKWHKVVRNKIAEDIKIMRLVKEKGFRGDVRMGGGIAKCRMYDNYFDAILGFSKNIFFIFGGTYSSFILLSYLLIVNNLILFNYYSFSQILGIMILLPVLRIITSIGAKQNILYNLLLFPFQKISLFIICVIGFYQKLSGQVTWRGRKALG